VLGVIWPRANGWGATAGMIAGLGITLYYLLSRPLDSAHDRLWFGVQPEAAGLFGVPLAFAVHAAVSLATSHHRHASTGDSALPQA
jgi:cation/acetate symporter